RTIDGFLYAQISKPDMRMSIQNALTYPDLSAGCFGALELADSPTEMMQARTFVVDDIELEVRAGQNDFISKTHGLLSRIDLYSRQSDPCGHLTEFSWLKENEPWVQITNPTDYALVVSRWALFGFRYLMDSMGYQATTVEEMEKRIQGPITFIPAGGA
ncbi:hypothetical protein LCGC14_2886440, partial [marine sediment metagenome]